VFQIFGHNVLGLFSTESVDESLKSQIESLLSERVTARKSKDWSKADSIRDKLDSMGIEIQDTPDGTKWRRI
jgi:cysteinyl-tRNA synthetase